MTTTTTTTTTALGAQPVDRFRTSIPTWCRAGHPIPRGAAIVTVAIAGSYTEQHWCEAHATEKWGRWTHA